MNENTAMLLAHAGAQKVSRGILSTLPVPEATPTHQPLSHIRIVEVLEEALSFRHISVVREEYAVSPDGMKMFGVMDLDMGFEGGRFSIGLRNANDKSMRLALTAGYRVFVCDNMAFSGDFAPLQHKHTRNLDLTDSIAIAVDRIQRSFAGLEQHLESMREMALNDDEARLLIYRAFVEHSIRGLPKHLMTHVHDLYFTPAYEQFKDRNLWSLANAFTSAIKLLQPLKQFEVTARLGRYLETCERGLAKRHEQVANRPAMLAVQSFAVAPQ